MKATASSRASAAVDLRFYRVDKRYEISNHSGNVLVVVSDRKLWVSSTTVNFDHYLVDLYSVQEYDPFGMGILERSWECPCSTCAITRDVVLVPRKDIRFQNEDYKAGSYM